MRFVKPHFICKTFEGSFQFLNGEVVLRGLFATVQNSFSLCHAESQNHSQQFETTP